ncbi:serine/threonine-protein kinase [Stigmatella sp. ncwal1]|uniref:Serine/threonine-protein kinase n=1 Tax=Stigmatella ashevillensis TaxID=2995309 RepID=A0ABT5D9T1_9BACT|nr:serine/threonine-protein kinase [Stigmatella ashevillena]MDC0710422.1 serine/threonine-protein kinase [Stigmatella ashevillena]
MGDSESTFRIQGRKATTPVPWRTEPGGEVNTDLPYSLAGEYLLKRLLASGGHGSVYEAEHRILGRRVAVKVLHPHLADQGEMLQRFVREARIVNQIRHPNVVDIHDFGMMPDGSPYYVMELLEGRTLSQLVQERGRMSAERALAYLEPVCMALGAAHQAGIVHRDLKASNVLVVEDGPTPQVKLLDFGIAKVLQPAGGQEGLTLAGQRLGTAYAMAPEQLRGGPINPNTDVYALGVLLFQLLTGRYPFQSKDRMELERLHLEAPPPRPSACAPVSLAVDAVVLRCLEKEAERRFPHTAAFLTALRQAVDTQGLASADGRAGHALAVHAEVEIAEGAHDDEVFHASLADVLDRLERELRQVGFLLALQVGTAQLGIRLLGAEHALSAAEANALRTALERMCLEVSEQARRLGARLHMCAHVGMVEVRGEAADLEVLGGPLTELSTWVIQAPGALHLTPSAAHILEFGA